MLPGVNGSRAACPKRSRVRSRGWQPGGHQSYWIRIAGAIIAAPFAKLWRIAVSVFSASPLTRLIQVGVDIVAGNSIHGADVVRVLKQAVQSRQLPQAIRTDRR